MIPDTIEAVKDFLDALNKIEDDWDKVYEEIGRADLEISDLLHEAELTEFNPIEGNQIAEEIKRVRKHRRELKDYQEIIRHVKEHLDRNKHLKGNLFKVLSSMERTRDFQKTRTYMPRVRTDLKLCSLQNQLNSKNETANKDKELGADNKTESYSSAEISVNLADVHEIIEPETEDTEEIVPENNFPDDREVLGDDSPLPFRSYKAKETSKQKEEKASETA